MKKTNNKIPDDFQGEEAKDIKVNTRCEILIGQRRGEVMYVGKVPELAPGFWIGVQLDEPTGDTNGMVMGKWYFKTTDGSVKSGCFVRPKDLAVGDFPPVADFDEDEDEI